MSLSHFGQPGRFQQKRYARSNAGASCPPDLPLVFDRSKLAIGAATLSKTAAFKERLEPEKLKTMLCARPFDRATWLENCSERLHIRIGSEDPILTRKLALDRLELFMRATLGFGTDFCDVWARRETIYVETEVLVSAADRADTIPCFIIARTTHRLLQDLRLYFDLSPVKLR